MIALLAWRRPSWATSPLQRTPPPGSDTASQILKKPSGTPTSSSPSSGPIELTLHGHDAQCREWRSDTAHEANDRERYGDLAERLAAVKCTLEPSTSTLAK
jgi:hypothetical protein